MHTASRDHTRTFEFPHDNGLVLDYWEQDSRAIILPPRVTKTVFYQLYFESNGGGVFEKIDGDGTYQLWRVLPHLQARSRTELSNLPTDHPDHAPCLARNTSAKLTSLRIILRW